MNNVRQFGVPFDLIVEPSIGETEQRDLRDMQRMVASHEARAALLKTQYAADVSGLVGRLSVPALVLHGRGDRIVRFALGREVAARLPNAKFTPFEGNSSVPVSVSHVI